MMTSPPQALHRHRLATRRSATICGLHYDQAWFLHSWVQNTFAIGQNWQDNKILACSEHIKCDVSTFLVPWLWKKKKDLHGEYVLCGCCDPSLYHSTSYLLLCAPRHDLDPFLKVAIAIKVRSLQWMNPTNLENMLVAFIEIHEFEIGGCLIMQSCRPCVCFFWRDRA